MTAPIHFEPTTVTDLAEILVPKHRHSSLARATAEFFIEEHTADVPPDIDTNTLRRFVDFLIVKKTYN